MKYWGDMKRVQVYLHPNDYEDFIKICKHEQRDLSYVGRKFIQKGLLDYYEALQALEVELTE